MRTCKLNHYALRLLFALSTSMSLTEAHTLTSGVCQSDDNNFNFEWCYDHNENPMVLYTEKFGPLKDTLFTLSNDNISNIFIPKTDGRWAYVPDDSFSLTHNATTKLWTFATKKGVVQVGKCKINLNKIEIEKNCKEILKMTTGG
ncbi:MAG: hypothetical protein K0R14_67 [Burkholderiales bacterium]|jgi:hypothetical protein|nr:hypothetical protein [Burkholderiales bacterium]